MPKRDEPILQKRDEPILQKRGEPSTSGSKLQEVGSLSQSREDCATVQSHVWPGVALVNPESFTKQKDVVSNVDCLPCLASTSRSDATLQQLVSTDVSQLKEKTTEAVSQNKNLSSHKSIQVSEHPIEKLSSHDRRMQKKDSLYTKLFVDWVPPQLESMLVAEENDDEDWLFGKSAKSSSVSDVAGASRDSLPCSASYAMQPRAHYLADAEIFALPFTVPF